MSPDIAPPSWLDRTAYPFTCRTYHHPDGRMHYVDEGHGPVLLFVHGTPDWSFGFRHLIEAFSATHRCVAVDHLGFGLSDKPRTADFTVAAHAKRLQGLIDHLGLRDLTLVVTDFGGGIGLQHALRHPENVKGLVIYNTWLWPLNEDKRFAKPARIARSWFGRMLYLRFGFSVNVMMPSAYGDRKKLMKAVHAHYRNALPDAQSRIATHALAKEILDAEPFWAAQWNQVERLRRIPALLCWGMKDKFIPPDFLDRWKRALPNAEVKTFPDAGHFLHEEAHAELSAALRAFVG
ncbi:MAG: alpha/beta fold hydrolase [Flavobacteriales bacterium]|nr:alpha/beta fold hydrolase [Flavobacteriales bacterium]